MGCAEVSTGGASAGCEGVMIAGVSGTDVAPLLRFGNPAEVVPVGASRATGAGSGVCTGAVLAALTGTSSVGCS